VRRSRASFLVARSPGSANVQCSQTERIVRVFLPVPRLRPAPLLRLPVELPSMNVSRLEGEESGTVRNSELQVIRPCKGASRARPREVISGTRLSLVQDRS